MEPDRSPEPEHSARSGSRNVALEIDLNEIPLSSPRGATIAAGGAFAGEAPRRCGSCGRAADAACGGGERKTEWRCFKCLLSRGRSESGSSPRGEGRLLDINASPPREAEVDGIAGEVGQGSMARDAAQNGAKMCLVRDMPFIGCSQITNASIHHYGSGLSLSQASPHGVIQIPQLSSNDVRGLWPTQILNSPLEIQREVYLKALKEYIYQRRGFLSDGWSVDFFYCKNRCKTSPVYCAPDGSRFDSMVDVARFLGLNEQGHSLRNENTSDGFASLQRRLHTPKQPLRLLRGNSSRENQNVGSALFQDPFPVQFEDFFILSPGKIDSRPSYHNIDQIWPVGYKSCWHDKISGSLFVSEVLEGGNAGPSFRVRRYPCSTIPIPVGSTVFSRNNPNPCAGPEVVQSSTNGMDDEILSIQMMLKEENPPHLGEVDFGKLSGLPMDATPVNLVPHEKGLGECIGEFSVESRSSSLAWEMVSRTLLHACHMAYKQMGRLQFNCKHKASWMGFNDVHTTPDQLSKFCCQSGPADIPHMIQNDTEFEACGELLIKWLEQDRFGLDMNFVQEILEQLPGAHDCLRYQFLSKRSQSSSPLTVQSGFLLCKRKSNKLDAREGDGFQKRQRRHVDEDPATKRPFPSGKTFAKLPPYLVGEVLQAWEFLWHFSENLGLREPPPLEQLENELIHPWVGTINPAEGTANDMLNWNIATCTGTALRRAHSSLLKAIVSELLLKVAAHVDPFWDIGESKPRRGKKKDVELISSSKKTKLDMLQLDELTWPELARRYILAFLLLEGNLDTVESNVSESSKVFHCLQGDGGILCGSLTGVAGMEADAMLLAEAKKQIFGLVKNNDFLTVDQQKPELIGTPRLIELNDDNEVPEWAQALEPVRKLPTNVGARIRKCVFDALAKNPPDWAKNILEHSISKDVYKGNASGPTKRAVVSLLSEISNKGLLPKPVKKVTMVGVKTFSDLLMKQCRIVLRQAAAADDEKVFCNLLGKTLYPNDNDDEGLFGSSAMVSRPLDFRVIDFRLAVGAYVGSHEAFFEEVMEMWNNIRIIYSDRSDLIELAEKLSQKFKVMYDEEVLLMVQKLPENSNLLCITDEAKREMDTQLIQVMESSLPKAPWDEGICKVCGVDKDDDNVLLCDGCDSEHHTYCLNPPLARIPDGNWYCPSCVAGRYKSQGLSRGAQVTRLKKKRNRGEFTRHMMEKLSQLAQSMGSKDYWNFNAEERTLLLKFLCDETLNTSILRDHMDHCASVSTDLQQKLRVLSTEWKNLKIREEDLVSHLRKSNATANTVGESAPDDLAPAHSGDSKPEGSTLNELNSGHIQPPHQSLPKSRAKTSPGNKKQKRKGLESQEELPDKIDNQILLPPSKSRGLESEHADSSTLQANEKEVMSIKHEISAIEETISRIKSELENMSVRKEFLGRDSAGRVYWSFGRPGTGMLLVDRMMENLSENNLDFGRSSLLGTDYPQTSCVLTSGWVLFKTDGEISELVDWLSSGEARDRELKESILQWRKCKANDSSENRFQNEKESTASNSGVRVTRAAAILEKRYGPCLGSELGDASKRHGQRGKLPSGRTVRCDCLELIWPSRHHCFYCHKSHSTSEELASHSDGNCVERINEDSRKGKKIAPESSMKKHLDEGKIGRALKEKNKTSAAKGKSQDPDSPHDFKEISSKFVTQNSLRELVRGIGLIGSGGTPSFIPGSSSYLGDPALRMVIPKNEDMSNGGDESKDSKKAQEGTNSSNNFPRCFGNGSGDEGTSKVEDLVLNHSNERDCFEMRREGGDHRCIIPESSLVRLVSRESLILRQLKMNLLDLDDALPEEAVRVSMAQPEKRIAWRAFVKSAGSIYEMVQATIVLENMIKADHLRKEWWYWSSLTAAANTSTLSALALRVSTLEAAIIFEKPSPTLDSTEITESNSKDNEVTPPSRDKRKQKKAPPSPTDAPKTRGRVNKRRKDKGN